jgi:hypothetical protein
MADSDGNTAPRDGEAFRYRRLDRPRQPCNGRLTGSTRSDAVVDRLAKRAAVYHAVRATQALAWKLRSLRASCRRA